MNVLDKKTIKLERITSELDHFVLAFVRIIEKHTFYCIISGYLAILFGRSRATEDIDMFIERMDKFSFLKMYQELKEKGFWCLNTEKGEDIFEYLQEGVSVRFARKKEIIPNMEIKFAKKPLDEQSLQDTVKVVTDKGTMIISSLESNIAYKRYALKSDKDIEDAKYLQEIFKEYIDLKKLKKIKDQIDHDA